MPVLARDVMQTDVITVTPDSPLPELADLLISKRIGGVPVIEKGAVIGIVSRSDLVRVFSLERSLAGVVAEGVEQEEFAPAEAPGPTAPPQQLTRQLEGRTVRDIMVVTAVTVSPQTPLEEVARLMVSRHLHRILVTEGRQLRGVITALDIARLVSEGRLREV